jgi:hypothetical protein
MVIGVWKPDAPINQPMLDVIIPEHGAHHGMLGQALTKVDSGADGGEALKWGNPPEGTMRGHCEGFCGDLREGTLEIKRKCREHDCDCEQANVRKSGRKEQMGKTAR